MENLKCLFNNFPWDIFLFWLLPMLLLAWWLWSKIRRYKEHAEELSNRIEFLEGELDSCRKKAKGRTGSVAAATIAGATSTSGDSKRIAKLEADLEACKQSKVKVEGMAAGAAGSAFAATSTLYSGGDKPKASKANSLVASEKPKAKKAAAKKSKKDDLKVIEGIGPKIAELCNKAGITTFADLASASATKLKEILDNAGPRFKMHDPTTWPQQAALANDGKWDELKKLQDELDKGRA